MAEDGWEHLAGRWTPAADVLHGDARFVGQVYRGRQRPDVSWPGGRSSLRIIDVHGLFGQRFHHLGVSGPPGRRL
jgi:hypothetical protein